jgi:hypothetical protein
LDHKALIRLGVPTWRDIDRLAPIAGPALIVVSPRTALEIAQRMGKGRSLPVGTCRRQIAIGAAVNE